MNAQPERLSPQPEIHPAAEVFRMMTEEELAELTADIAANGLRDPIVLDRERRVIDGRNRLRACELTGVKPHFETYEGDDVEAFVWSRSGARRNINASMKAMALAMLYPEGQQGKKANFPQSLREVSETYLRQARKGAPPLAASDGA